MEVFLCWRSFSRPTVSPAPLTFTQGNWWRYQTVTVTGVDDAVADGDQAWSVA